MPTRKQRRRAAKERRHEYETVWVDAEGNELAEPPEELARPPAKRNGATPKPKASQQRGGRPARSREVGERGGGEPGGVPLLPEWQQGAVRSLIQVGVMVQLFYEDGSK